MVQIDVIGARAVVRKQDILTCRMVGATVDFRFDEKWDGLTKTAVFCQGNVVKDVLDIDITATIPWEVLQIAGVPVLIGVYGTNEDGTIVIPTNWAATNPVQSSADPSGDESADPSLPVWQQVLNKLNAVTPAARLASVELLAENWVGDASPYSQVVSIDGITEYSQVDLTPSVEQLAIFYEKDLSFVTENEDGVVTVYAIGDKPANDYTIQATVTEVSV